MVRPPASLAPRAAASMTPERPPHTSVAPASATRRPTSIADAYSAAPHCPPPITEMYSGLHALRIASAS